MDAQIFWNVIGIYNQQTVAVQIVLFLFAVITAVLSYSHKVKWAAKFALGIIHLFIGIAFFAWHGVEPIQKYFALPLYLLCGFLFLYESWHNRNDILEKPNGWQCLLLVLYLLYPLVSFLLGNRFPQMVTHKIPSMTSPLSLPSLSSSRSRLAWASEGEACSPSMETAISL